MYNNLINEYNQISQHSERIGHTELKKIVSVPTSNNVETIQECMIKIRNLKIKIDLVNVKDDFMYLIPKAFCIRFLVDASNYVNLVSEEQVETL